MLKEIISDIQKDLHRYDGYSHEQLYTDFVAHKLNAALEMYNEDIARSSSQLVKSESVRVMKALAKMQKREDVATIKNEIEKIKETPEV